MLAILLLSTCVGCGGGSQPSALVGKWEGVDGMSMEFSKDGTGSMGVVNMEGIIWKVESGRLHIANLSGTHLLDYKISGGTLTITCDTTGTITLRRAREQASSANHPSALVGNWAGGERELELFRDGRVRQTLGSSAMLGTWKVEGNRTCQFSRRFDCFEH